MTLDKGDWKLFYLLMLVLGLPGVISHSSIILTPLKIQSLLKDKFIAPSYTINLGL